MELQRHPGGPVLEPDPTSDWEASNVFNPAVNHHGGLFHMHYRAQGLDRISRIGYAVSTDGVEWNRLRRPVLEPVEPIEARGVEDPRITEIDGVFYMAYTAYSGSGPEDHITTPMLATSTNLITWERLGPIIGGERNKDHLLFPRRAEGRYLALHRRPPSIWIAETPDLTHWPESFMRVVMSPRPDSWWDSKRIGANGVPIYTDDGWLLIYHGFAADHVYRFGVCLLDLDDPGRVISRAEEPIFEPRTPWELQGDVPNVVFSTSNPVVDGTVYVHYGAADHVIGLATCSLDELAEHARSG